MLSFITITFIVIILNFKLSSEIKFTLALTDKFTTMQWCTNIVDRAKYSSFIHIICLLTKTKTGWSGVFCLFKVLITLTRYGTRHTAFLFSLFICNNIIRLTHHALSFSRTLFQKFINPKQIDHWSIF